MPLVCFLHLQLIPPLLPFSSRFRQMCQSIIAHKLFDYVVLAFIFSNCITVALERPKILQGSLVNLLCGSFLCYLRTNSITLPKRCSKLGFTIDPSPLSNSQPLSPSSCLSAQERVFLTISNYIFTAIFVSEMTLKVTFYSPSLNYSQCVLSVVCAGTTQRHLFCLSPPVSPCLSPSLN